MKRALSAALATAMFALPQATDSLAQVVVAHGPSGYREAGFAFDGIHVEGGIAQPLRAEDEPVVGAALHLGTLLTNWLDFTVGARRWSAGLDRGRYGLAQGGDLTDFQVFAGLEYGLPGLLLGVRPFAGAGIAAHALTADIPEDPHLADSIEGLRAGAWTGVGVMTAQEGFGLRVQARRDFVDHAAAWSYTIGLGWWPHEHAWDGYSVRAPRTTYLAAPPAPAATAPQPEVTPAVTTPAVTTPAATAPARPSSPEPTLAPPVAQRAPQPAPAASPPPAPDARPATLSPSRPADARDAFTRDLAQIAPMPGRLATQPDGSGPLALGRPLTFATGSEALDIGSREALRRVAALLLRHPAVYAVVEGHTDNVGEAERNRLLSLGRAVAVRDELERLGVPGHRLRVEGRGEVRPVADNGTADGRARNRRVELVFNLEAPGR